MRRPFAAAGTIRAAHRKPATSDLDALVNARAGKPCRAFSQSTAGYFAFHRDQQILPAGGTGVVKSLACS